MIVAIVGGAAVAQAMFWLLAVVFLLMVTRALAVTARATDPIAVIASTAIMATIGSTMRINAPGLVVSATTARPSTGCLRRGVRRRLDVPVAARIGSRGETEVPWDVIHACVRKLMHRGLHL